MSDIIPDRWKEYVDFALNYTDDKPKSIILTTKTTTPGAIVGAMCEMFEVMDITVKHGSLTIAIELGDKNRYYAGYYH